MARFKDESEKAELLTAATVELEKNFRKEDFGRMKVCRALSIILFFHEQIILLKVLGSKLL